MQHGTDHSKVSHVSCNRRPLSTRHAFIAVKISSVDPSSILSRSHSHAEPIKSSNWSDTDAIKNGGFDGRSAGVNKHVHSTVHRSEYELSCIQRVNMMCAPCVDT